ncbi:hypothetical protein K438DRAFT_1759915 [Mycena galopus ATCC 62051]|nr:hypothetical protein K438DRAFT_1759915 [Mycena galopus ATCC 62051]
MSTRQSTRNRTRKRWRPRFTNNASNALSRVTNQMHKASIFRSGCQQAIESTSGNFRSYREHIIVMSNPPTNKHTTRSTRNTPTTNATTLPGGANTPARSAPDAPTDGTPRTPTPAPERAPSRQGSVATAADPPPPLPLNEDATASTPHVRSPPPPQANTLPFSSMVATAAAGLATPATEIEPAAISSGKGKNKEKGTY